MRLLTVLKNWGSGHRYPVKLKKGRNILICPLEWGLGHAARMIPVAGKLLEQGNTVFIGAGEQHLSLFRTEIVGLKYISFPGFRASYSRYLPQYIALLLQTPLLLYHIIKEHHGLKRIIADYQIDIVISDNRFGLWNRKIRTAYVTHMPLIPLPSSLRFLERIGVLLHRAVIKRYSLCLIPDLPGDTNISGRLSHGIMLPPNVRYAGIISRFATDDSVVSNQVNFPHYTVILSGPDPQRGILREKMVNILKNKIPSTIMFEGKPENTGEKSSMGNILFYSHLPAREMKEVIKSSEMIITRSGYTTIMDLVTLGCSALLIPTPGQTEQEYLAQYLSEKGWFTTVDQGRIEKDLSMQPIKASLPADIIEQSKILLDSAIKELLEEPQVAAKADKSDKKS